MTKENQNLTFSPIDERVVSLRANWLSDPEITGLVFNNPLTQLSVSDNQRWYKNYSADESKKFWYIEIGGVPIGIVGLINIDLEKKKSKIFIMIGDKSFWGRGIGKAAIDFVIMKAIGFGINNLNLEVFKNNSRAIKLYQSNNFKVSRENENELVMSLSIKKEQ